MKLCIPSMGDRGLNEAVGEHFGRVPCYTIYDTASKEVEVLKNTSAHMGGTGYPAQILADAGIDAMVCGGIGQRAIQMFDDQGIVVFSGARGSVGDAVQLWENGVLEAATNANACKQHAFRGEGTGDGHEHHH